MFEKPELEIILFPKEDIAVLSVPGVPEDGDDLTPDDGEMDWD